MYRLLHTFVLALAVPLALWSQDTTQGVTDSRFRTLQVGIEGNPAAPAVLHPGAGDRLVIEFDEMADETRWLRWSVEHCDAQWRPESLTVSEFTEGMNEATVDDVAYSQGTLSHYVHYRITLPDSRVPLKLSGNYLLSVWDENDPDTPLVRVRFAVSEGSVGIDGTVSPVTDIDYLGAHQQLSLKLDVSGADIANPYSDLITIVRQDDRDDATAVLRQPSYLRGSTVVYEHQRPLIFKGGSEYRRFETVRTDFPGIGIDGVWADADGYHARVVSGEPRGGKNMCMTRPRAAASSCGRSRLPTARATPAPSMSTPGLSLSALHCPGARCGLTAVSPTGCHTEPGAWPMTAPPGHTQPPSRSNREHTTTAMSHAAPASPRPTGTTPRATITKADGCTPCMYTTASPASATTALPESARCSCNRNTQ